MEAASRHNADLAAADEFTHQAYDLLLSGKAQRAFNLEEESAATRDAYGRDSLGEKTLMARRLVEAGVTFVTVSGAWGYFDHHGDNVRWGGIEKGLKPLLPSVDRTLHAIVTDLEARGLLESTLVLMMGEFGRGPVINKEAGRDHWPRVMSMVMAGGRFRHGQVIGSTDKGGYEIASRRIGPSDLAATVFHHLGSIRGALGRSRGAPASDRDGGRESDRGAGLRRATGRAGGADGVSARGHGVPFPLAMARKCAKGCASKPNPNFLPP